VSASSIIWSTSTITGMRRWSRSTPPPATASVVRYVQYNGDSGTAEVAATVVDDWQGRGLGGAMLARLAQRAREEGHCALRASTLSENRRSIAMLRSAGFTSRSRDGILREFELALG